MENQKLRAVTYSLIVIAIILAAFAVYSYQSAARNKDNLTSLQADMDLDFTSQLAQVRSCFGTTLEGDEYQRCLGAVSAASELSRFTSYWHENGDLVITLNGLYIAMTHIANQKYIIDHAYDLYTMIQDLLSDPTDTVATQKIADFSSDLVSAR